MTASRRARAAAAVPRGTGTVGAWLLFSGVAAYAFLAIANRALGADEASGLSALWALAFLVGPGACLPIEQEVSRAVAARRAGGIGSGPVVRTASVAAATLAGILAVAALAAGPALVSELFTDQVLLLAGFVALLVGYAGEYLARGVLAGNERFGPYGRLLGGEAVARVVGAAVLALVGVAAAGPYGLVVGIAPFVGIAVALGRPADRHGLAPAGPPAPWHELSRALGWLLAASLLAQVLVNAGPVLVQLLGGDQDEAATSRFLASLVIARVPIFLFQAVQAVYLPRLSGYAGQGAAAQLTADLRRLGGAVGALCVVATLGAALLGPTVVRIAFGAEFALGSTDLAMLAAASSIYLLALTFAQALIALQHQARVALGWAVGVVALVSGTFLSTDLVERVELGYLLGSIAATVAMGALLLPALRAARGGAAGGWITGSDGGAH
jgi:O-antigen/teichoic acid export membrane protein